jgi:hypothetical protein
MAVLVFAGNKENYSIREETFVMRPRGDDEGHAPTPSFAGQRYHRQQIAFALPVAPNVDILPLRSPLSLGDG